MRQLSISLAAQLHVERQLDSTNYRFVIGVDEVGRGSWAGPLGVGAVVYDLQLLLELMSGVGGSVEDEDGKRSERLDYLRVDDSKRLSAKLRTSLDGPIKELAVGYGIGMVEPSEIDEMGMSSALALGLDRALMPVRRFLDHSLLLLDGTVNFSRYSNSMTLVKGDSKSFAIASASIIAKVARDSLMEAESLNFPWYVFERNKGYPSLAHVSALHAIGPSLIHRRSWSYMAGLPWQSSNPSPVFQQLSFWP
ncbi:MAG: ribonuclease HII [Actinomycetota bacterium]|nr:ribonuclease HII [Actinomycetota bacterium]